MKRRRKNKFVRKISKLFDRPKKEVSKPAKQKKIKEKKQDNSKEKPKFSVVEGKKSVIKKNRIIFGAICVVLVAVYIIGNAVSPVSITESFSCMSAVSGGGDGFPVLIEEGSSKNLHYAHSQILTLTDTHLLSFNSNGKKVYQRLHGFANPVVSSSRGRTLVFDRGGKNYRIENAHETIFSGSLEQKIIAGAMSDCGNYVFATESDKAVASATVFDKNDVALYRYNSSKDQILNVAISNDGEQIAVVTISSQNAEFVAGVLILDDSAEVVADFKIKNQIPVFVDYTSNDKVRVVTNKNIYLFDDNKETEKTSLNKMQISSFKENEDDSLVVGLSADVGANKGKILLIDEDGELDESFSVDCRIDDIAWSGNRIYILSDKLYVFSKAGELIESKKVGSGAFAIRAFSSSVMILSSGRLQMLTI